VNDHACVRVRSFLPYGNAEQSTGEISGICSGVLVATNRMLALATASQIASASVASFLCRFTYGFT
jgi:hypothetical protein